MASTVRDRRRDDRARPDSSSSRKSSSRLPAKREPQLVKSRHIITEHIDVGVPADEAFGQWTKYEKWSQMFKNESADAGGKKSGDGGRGRGRQEIQVRAKIGPSERQWKAQIVSTEAGHRINWRSRGPLQAMGSTSFHRLDDRLTHVMVEMEYKPTGFLETVGNFFRMQRRRVRRDLRLFKNYVELRGVDDDEKPDDRGDEKGDGHGDEKEESK